MSNADFLTELHEQQRAFDALEPEMEVTVRDPSLDVEGYVIVWSTLAVVDGPLGRVGKGGTRITPTVTKDEIGRLARTQTLKNAAAGLATGGAKSGLRADPKAPGFEKQYRRFVSLSWPCHYDNGGPWGGLGYDLGGDPMHCQWAIDQLGTTRCFTGKPVEQGGTDYDAEGIAGLGVATAASTWLKRRADGPKGARACVQGVGAMGAAVCRYFTEQGGEIHCLADPRIDGAWRLHAPLSGALLDAIATMDFVSAREHLKAEGHQQIGMDDVLWEETDVLFPCAVQDVIDTHNQERIQAKVVVEGANNPCTAAARHALHERGLPVVPDFIANPGGAIAASVEMTSAVKDEDNAVSRAKVVEAKETTQRLVTENVGEVLDIAEAHGAALVDAASLLALRRVLGT
ncbi:MAG: Glu/Leu/Phe/Val dehydrogenase dimerization domain-containing protein [Phycisphaerales bacterium]|nr:Glu/Leu/Phe/Val dehydrogenase dimerization domain-containing protein [Phycisphaerales bacterium]